VHSLDRIGDVSVEQPETGTEIPYQSATGWPKDAGDLIQAGHGVGPVMHRERPDNQVKRSIAERQGCHISDDEGRRAPARRTMSQIAEETGIGRATLYKYFPDVEAILLAWHDRQIAAHIAYLEEVRGPSR
jgi:Bacterial regulatory proteins, tetR family